MDLSPVDLSIYLRPNGPRGFHAVNDLPMLTDQELTFAVMLDPTIGQVDDPMLVRYLAETALDNQRIGTAEYSGWGIFWHTRYHTLLSNYSSLETRVAVHTALLEAGLSVDGNTGAHDDIVARIAGAT